MQTWVRHASSRTTSATFARRSLLEVCLNVAPAEYLRFVPNTKRCQVCGQEFDPELPDGWRCAVAFKGRHVPTDRPGTVYILHFSQPTDVAEADRRHVRPTTHYVGWTSQDLSRRVRQHGASEASVVYSVPGTAEDEAKLKRQGTCPRCGLPLAPECLGARA